MTDHEYIEVADPLMTEEEQNLYANLRGMHDHAISELKKLQKRETELEKHPNYDSSVDLINEGDGAGNRKLSQHAQGEAAGTAMQRSRRPERTLRLQFRGTRDPQ